jgi:hypothetical protein
LLSSARMHRRGGYGHTGRCAAGVCPSELKGSTVRNEH